jgi:hypothetical protein
MNGRICDFWAGRPSLKSTRNDRPLDPTTTPFRIVTWLQRTRPLLRCSIRRPVGIVLRL